MEKTMNTNTTVHLFGLLGSSAGRKTKAASDVTSIRRRRFGNHLDMSPWL
jgi:hypothetical protein